MSEKGGVSWEIPVLATLRNAKVQASMRPPEEWRQRDECTGKPLGYYRLVRDLFAPEYSSLKLKRSRPERTNGLNYWVVSCTDRDSPILGIYYTEQRVSSGFEVHMGVPTSIGDEQIALAALLVQDKFCGHDKSSTRRTVGDKRELILEVGESRKSILNTVVDEVACAFYALAKLDQLTTHPT